MRDSVLSCRYSRTALATLLVSLSLVACDGVRDPIAPGIGGTAVADAQRREVLTHPASALAEYPIALRLSGDELGDGATYEWFFGDGTRATGPRVTKTFRDSGATVVRVRVTDANGRARHVERVMTVGPSIAALATVLTGVNPGGRHGCAIDVGQTLSCWGYNGYGTIGDGTTTNRLTPVPVGVAGAFAQVATGFMHSCALTTAGAAYCWGRNHGGQLGDGTLTSRSTPTLVQGGLTFTSIDVGYDHSCAIADSGIAYCWGGNSYGQLGDGLIAASSAVPKAVAGGLLFTMIRAGYFHSCAIQSSTGTVHCWGSNWMGQLGNGLTSSTIAIPTAISGNMSFTQLDAGGYHTCGTTANIAYCWGWNGYGQIGASTNGTCGTAQPCTRVPVKLNASLRFVGVSTGISHSCAIESSGDIHCWGHNSSGQLGDGTTVNQPLAKKVLVGTAFKSVRADGEFSCGVALDNKAYCWGNNGLGRLGLGDTANRLTPTQIASLNF